MFPRSFLKFSARALAVAGALAVLTSCQSDRRYIRERDYTAPIRVACVGDSITWGRIIKDRDHDSYPAQLNAMLGPKWEVRNFGVNGATALVQGSRPYTAQPEFRDALAFKPDVVVLKLGTNDTSWRKSWPAHGPEFEADYAGIVRSFAALDSHPRIFVCLCVPMLRNTGQDEGRNATLTQKIFPIIRKIAEREKLVVIDLYTPFDGKPEMFPDGVHPDEAGSRGIAELVYAELVGHPAADRKFQPAKH